MRREAPGDVETGFLPFGRIHAAEAARVVERIVGAGGIGGGGPAHKLRSARLIAPALGVDREHLENFGLLRVEFDDLEQKRFRTGIFVAVEQRPETVIQAERTGRTDEPRAIALFQRRGEGFTVFVVFAHGGLVDAQERIVGHQRFGCGFDGGQSGGPFRFGGGLGRRLADRGQRKSQSKAENEDEFHGETGLLAEQTFDLDRELFAVSLGRGDPAVFAQ